MIDVNEQHPFDVSPDDERRPAPDAAQPTAPIPAAASPADQASPADPQHPEAAPLRDQDAPADAADAEAEPEVVDAEAHRTKRKHQRVAALGIAAAVIFTAGAGGGAAASLALARSTTAASAGSTLQPGGTGEQDPQNGFGPRNGFGGGTGTTDPSTGSGATDTTTATSDQISGLVTIVSKLGYESGEAAGTGIVLTSGGRILTNNHVIDGATSIEVTDVSTGSSYAAQVVGTNATRDVAVLQLEDATGLATADIATDSPSVGDDVTAVGNANGTGTLSAAAGTVSALDQTITTSSEDGTAGETLEGLIEIDADVVSGDSGGAVEDADGDVIGVTTAASSGTSQVTGYAIPIDSALSVAKQIVAGDDTDEITIGLPAFLGVSLKSTTGSTGAVVEQVLEGTAAAATDLAEGDVITGVGGTTVSSREQLSAAIAEHAPGDRVQVTYTDTDGGSHTVTVTLTEGPAD